jgi:hypothetical protein
MEPIVNRVAESDIIVFNLEELWDGHPVHEIDIAPMLFRGLVLREREFREQVKAYDFSAHRDAHVAVHCSTDAIVPVWAFMLIASRLDGVAASVALGTPQQIIRDRFTLALAGHDWDRFAGRIVVVKGCGSRIVPASAYVEATRRLQSVANKIMYGEPCSSVPVWRKPKEAGRSAAGAPETMLTRKAGLS